MQFGKCLVFDHHDLCPELFAAKFGRRGLIHRLLFSYYYRDLNLLVSDTIQPQSKILIRRNIRDRCGAGRPPVHAPRDA